MRTTLRRAGIIALLLCTPASIIGTSPALAAERPTCNGQTANIVGTQGKDSYAPSKFHDGDVVALLGGRDYAQVGGHTDNVTICGGRNDDEIVGDAGAGKNLRFFGDKGSDSLGSLFEQGKSASRHGYKLDGGPGRDYFDGSKRHDRVEGGAGPDVVRGYKVGDVVHGGRGEDLIEGGPGEDTLFGDQDDDALYGFYYQTRTPNRERVDSVFGGPGRDICVAKHRHSCKKDRR